MIYSVVIPAHNESKNIEKLVSNIYTILKKEKKEFEIIVVNDNSSDNTKEVLEMLHKRIRELKVFHKKGSPGVGYAKRLAFSKARGKYIITMDGDLSHNPFEIPKFIRAIKSSDMVCGSRYVVGGRADLTFGRRLISRSFNAIFKNLIGLPVKDFTSGFRIFKRSILSNINLRSKSFGIYVEIPIMVYLAGYKISEIAITYHKRTEGISNLNYLNQGPEYINVAFRGIFMKLFNRRLC